MPYTRTNYKLVDIQLGFRSIDTNMTQGNVGGQAGTQPVPHADKHGADELRFHPIFAKARVTAGDGPKTHSVMDQTEMQAALVDVFNDAQMQPFLTKVDNGDDAHINVNITGASPGVADVYKADNNGGATHTQGAVVAFFIKVRPNPNNKDVPIIQTCVPMTTQFTAGQLVNKKGVVNGFAH
jgi:hypothetical protein